MDGYTSRVAADRPMFVAECSACPHSGLAGFALPWLARLILLLLLPFSPAVRSKILMTSPLVASRSWSSGRSAPCRSTSTPTPLTRPTTCSKYRHRLFVPGTSARLDQLHELHPSTASINRIRQLHPSTTSTTIWHGRQLALFLLRGPVACPTSSVHLAGCCDRSSSTSSTV